VVLVTYGNGVHLSLRAARTLSAQHGISAEVMDLRWLRPLPSADIVREATRVGRVVAVDECRRSGNVSEELAALLLDAGYRGRFARVTSADCFIPLGEAAERVLLSEPEIVETARALCAKSPLDES
jgi:2-oxoisovalerate dehydrogenase E1 component